ncbi:uncharacterized protein LOC135142550 [Zophobas morio]|uniref:uncharacterized protein LOC135142550 n=1 Tax=Zophobas morio TaxID=2755281 RepID=UPI003083E6D4
MAQVLKETKLIVWDECTMAHKGGVEALSKTLRDIRENGSLMGGVTVLLAGDFRQNLPVVPRGTRADEVRSCLKSSYLWPQIKKLALKTNMRVLLGDDATVGEFAQTVLQIGDGNYPTVDGKIIIPPTLATVVESLTELTNKIYPDIINLKAKSIDCYAIKEPDPPKLCNGTRLQITALHHDNHGMLQFPLKVCFAITINKAQGQTLKMAGIDLMEDCFSHGQFYVACSRVARISALEYCEAIATGGRSL